MNTCLNCGKETKNPKFCSTNCSGTYNNNHPSQLVLSKRKKLEGSCKVCGKAIQTTRVYCEECRKVVKDAPKKNKPRRRVLVLPREYKLCESCGTKLLNKSSKLCRTCYNIKKNVDLTKPHKCPKCGEIKNPDQFYGKAYWCSICLNKSTVEIQRKFKRLLIDYKGSKCIKCGYSACESALEFHHIDPSKKDFGLSKVRTTTLTETIKQELDKCVLLCANCHRELHSNFWILDLVLPVGLEPTLTL